jgi:uncharacterized protein DUF6152
MSAGTVRAIQLSEESSAAKGADVNDRKLPALPASLLLGSLWLAGSASAHHAFVAQYDAASQVKIEGVIVKIEWMNPHAYFFVDVADEKTGKPVTWACEMGSPTVLVRRGWTRNSLQIGEVVTVDGARARDGTASINAESVVLTSTGQKLFTRSAGEQREAEAAAGADKKE